MVYHGLHKTVHNNKGEIQWKKQPKNMILWLKE